MDQLSVSEHCPGRRVSFDHNEHTNYNIEYNETNASASESPKLSETSLSKSHKSKHGFFSEFEIVKPPALSSTYSLQSRIQYIHSSLYIHTQTQNDQSVRQRPNNRNTDKP